MNALAGSRSTPKSSGSPTKPSFPTVPTSTLAPSPTGAMIEATPRARKNTCVIGAFASYKTARSLNSTLSAPSRSREYSAALSALSNALRAGSVDRLDMSCTWNSPRAAARELGKSSLTAGGGTHDNPSLMSRDVGRRVVAAFVVALNQDKGESRRIEEILILYEIVRGRSIVR